MAVLYVPRQPSRRAKSHGQTYRVSSVRMWSKAKARDHAIPNIQSVPPTPLPANLNAVSFNACLVRAIAVIVGRVSV